MMSLMQKHTDPTYLRTIYGGLVSGSLHKDKTSALPASLVGIYEEALPPESNVNKRKKFLEFFAVWALLKKEVSAAFVSHLLGWTEKRVLDYTVLYSKWFNAPLTGKYILYHERFRSFVLQKISHAQFAACNETIIKLGKTALETLSGDEWEQYALEHLSTHLLIQAMESKDATALKTLAYSAIYWNRQVEKSNGFEWSKRMLNDMMLWASKFDEGEVIECALYKLDLHNQEQNAFGDIFKLIDSNDFYTAAERSKYFGDNSLLGRKRKIGLLILLLHKPFKALDDIAFSECAEIVRQLAELDSDGIDIYSLFNDEFLFKISSFLSDNSIDIPQVLLNKNEIETSNKITDERNAEDSHRDLFNQIIDLLSNVGIETQQLDNFIHVSLEKKLDVVCQLVDEMEQIKALKINKFNSLLCKLADLLLRNKVTYLEPISRRFKLGITTKSLEFNSFLENWTKHAIDNEQWDLATEIVEYCVDIQLKVRLICRVSLKLNQDRLSVFLNRFLPQIQVDDKTIDLIFFTGSQFDCWQSKNNPFFRCGLSLKMESSPVIKHEQLLKAINFTDPNADSLFIENLAVLSDNHISNLANNSNVREFVLHKMMIGTLSMLLKKGSAVLVTERIMQLYKLIGDLEDWLLLISDLIGDEAIPLLNREGLPRELAKFVDNLIYEEYIFDLPERQKRRIIESNFTFLKYVYQFNSKQDDWQLLLTELKIESALQENKGSILNTIEIDSIRYCEGLVRKIPIGSMQEIYDFTKELVLFSRFNIYFPGENSRLLQM
jgi:hypothetical protein